MINFNEKNLSVELFPPKDNYQIMEFAGNLDKLGLDSAREKLEDAADKLTVDFLVFDFEKLEFINSESIGFLLVIHTRLVKNNKKLVIINSKAHVKDVFEVIGMTNLISFYDSLKEFLDSLKG